MVADLREMQENQGFSENLIDKPEFAIQLTTLCFPINQFAVCRAGYGFSST